MIVRAILDDPTLADNFDYPNDIKDTLAWLIRIPTSVAAAEATEALVVGFAKYAAQEYRSKSDDNITIKNDDCPSGNCHDCDEDHTPYEPDSWGEGDGQGVEC